MTTAEMIAPTIMKPVGWAEICDRYPNEWVCLVDVEYQTDGPIRSGRVVGHAYAHTGGCRLRRPRIEMTDEIRDIIRTRR